MTNAATNTDRDAIETACESFLADWNRGDWMVENGDWADDGDYIEEGTIDPDNVEDDAESLDVGAKSQGWDCQEGWGAYRSMDDLYLNWWRAPYPNTNRHQRDLWVLVSKDFFAVDEG